MSKRITSIQRLNENPTVPLETFLTCSVSQEKWKMAMMEFMTRLKNSSGMDLEKFHEYVWKLASKRKPPFQWTGEFRFFVYEMPTYRVFVNNTKGICMEVPAHFNRNQALDAMGDYMADINVGERCPLPMSEYVNLLNQGMDAVRGKEMDWSTGGESPETLRKFVIGYCDGLVWTTENVPPNMIQMVFLPIMFGALDLPQDLVNEILPKLPPDPGTRETFAEPEPKDEDLPEVPPKPKAPKTINPDPELVDKLERGEFFGTLVQGESLATYLSGVELQNKEAEAQYQADLIAWGLDNATLLERQEEIKRNNAANKAAWEERKKQAEDTCAYDLAEARHSVALAGARQQYWKDLGCVWEIMEDSNTAGRSVNGMPMFFSCRLMSKPVYARACAAIEREMDHRKSMVI